MGDYHRMTVRLSDEARRGFDRVSEHEGVSLSALFEACGRLFDEDPGMCNPVIIDLARSIDRERRAR